MPFTMVEVVNALVKFSEASAGELLPLRLLVCSIPKALRESSSGIVIFRCWGRLELTVYVVT